MKKERNYRPIIVGVFLHPEEHNYTVAGTHEWNPHFIERHGDYQKYFEERLIDLADQSMGESEWAIFFTQMSQEGCSWLVDLYVNDPAEYVRLQSVVLANIPPEFKLSFFPGGNLGVYLNKN